MAKPLHEPGLIVDGFRLEEVAHMGGMATLWRVSRADATTPMLMKVPKIGEGTDPAAIVSFEMEQMILPRLTGVHVPKFIAVGDFATQPYIVIERIPGKTLLTRLPELPLPYAEVADIGVKIAQALDDLHRQHVVHLDIKPSNIMFRPTGEAVLLDFGLSHHDQLPDLMQEEFRLPFGTAPYMSPEQLRGIRNDPRSDRSLWACCSISSRPAYARLAKARPCAECGGGCGAIRFRRASCGPTIRSGCRKSCCGASRSSRAGATRPPPNSPSI
jgi:non-specific serine/threonine protein kinase/protein-serine/threonine kinase